MQEERRPMDPTRRLLRVFGVKVTDYEAKTAALLERAAATSDDSELLQLTLEAADLTADLTDRLREMTSHVLEAQSRVLGELRASRRARGTEED
jgi:hypothetical protein